MITLDEVEAEDGGAEDGDSNEDEDEDDEDDEDSKQQTETADNFFVLEDDNNEGQKPFLTKKYKMG